MTRGPDGKISNFGFRISNFRKRLGKRSSFTGGAWHPNGKRVRKRGVRRRRDRPRELSTLNSELRPILILAVYGQPGRIAEDGSGRLCRPLPGELRRTFAAEPHEPLAVLGVGEEGRGG